MSDPYADLLGLGGLGNPKPPPPAPPAPPPRDPAVAIYEAALRELACGTDPDAPAHARIARKALREAREARLRP